MKFSKKFDLILFVLIILAFLVLLFSMMTGSARGAIMQWDLNTEYTGADSPEDPPPWVVITIDDDAEEDAVLIVISQNLVKEEFLKTVLLNVDPNVGIKIQDFYVLTPEAPVCINLANNAFHAAGDGWFDILFEFRSFSDDISIVINNPDLTVASFNFESEGGPRPLYTAAHIGGIGEGGEGSGWITTYPTPEPGSLLLLLTGIPLIFSGIPIVLHRKENH